MRILLTGASGRLGTAVRRRIERTRPDLETVAWVSPRSTRAGDRVDLANLGSIGHSVRSLDVGAVVHLAGLTGQRCDIDTELTRRINVEATVEIARAAAESGASRFVFASTAAIYGDRYSAPVEETAEPRPTTAYAASKLAAEAQLAELADEFPGFSVAALRIFNIYGEGFVDSLVSRLLTSTETSPVSLRGDHAFVRDYVDADDVADAAITAIGVALPQTLVCLNIGSGVPLTNEELVRILERDHPLHYRLMAQPMDGEPSYSCAVIERARELLGFSPRSLADEG